MKPEATKGEKYLMTKRRKRHTTLYKIADFAGAMMAWATFFLYRKRVEGSLFTWEIFEDPNFWSGILVVPTGWLLFYSIFDRYKDIYRLSRLATLTRTLFLSFLGTLALFFAFILDD
ncbi:MAG: sugar transferase, partial [Bacteroidota bacterium]